jgi:hypothetical protein
VLDGNVNDSRLFGINVHMASKSRRDSLVTAEMMVHSLMPLVPVVVNRILGDLC